MGFQVTIQPSGHRFELKDNETLLEGALREGYGLPYGCRSGACGTCKGHIVSGSVNLGEPQPQALTEEDRARGLALLCLAKAESDVVIEAQMVAGVKDITIKKMPVRVESLERVTPDVIILKLKYPAAEQFNYLPGQYIDFIMKDGKRRSFSLASIPGEGHLLELHIRNNPGGTFSRYVFEELAPKTILRLEGPLGTFFLRKESDKPIVFMAGGTGFAPIKGIIEQALQEGSLRPMVLYWGVRTESDLYLLEILNKWQSEHSHFNFIPVLSEPESGSLWRGRTGLVHEAILADFEDLSGYQVYACGSPLMVDAGKRAFTETRGLPEEEFYSDPFTVAVDVKKTAP